MRRNFNDKEQDLLQRLKQENRLLKRRVDSLKKQLSRIDIERYNNLKELINKHYQEDEQIKKEDLLKNLKEEWKCYKSGCSGYLEIFLITKIKEIWYYRRCSECGKRTKAKKYSSEVKGIIKNDSS